MSVIAIAFLRSAIAEPFSGPGVELRRYPFLVRGWGALVVLGRGLHHLRTGFACWLVGRRRRADCRFLGSTAGG